MTHPQHIPNGTVLAGKLRVIRLLGAGGVGEVYEVEHELTKHRRAMKTLHAEFQGYPEIVGRFLREASAAGRIGNPHIVETFDAGQLDTGEPYLVMEMLKGEVLTDLLRSRGRFAPAEICQLIIETCEGVQAAHDARIVHRDLKPDNIFITTRDGRPFVKVLDFGVSKFEVDHASDMGLTQEGTAIGTPYYMPPEQMRGERNIDGRADVYALGVILYECLSSKRPYEAETLFHLSVLIHEANPQSLADLCPDLPLPLVDIVKRAMARDREERFASPRDLAAALHAYSHVSHSAFDRAFLPRDPTRAKSTMDAESVPGSSFSLPGLRRSATARALVLGGVVTVAAGTGLAFALKGGERPSPAQTASVSALHEAEGLAIADTKNTEGARQALPAITLEQDAGTLSPLMVHPAAVREKAAQGSIGGSQATSRAAPSATTRVEQKGLATENPFR